MSRRSGMKTGGKQALAAALMMLAAIACAGSTRGRLPLAPVADACVLFKGYEREVWVLEKAMIRKPIVSAIMMTMRKWPPSGSSRGMAIISAT